MIACPSPRDPSASLGISFFLCVNSLHTWLACYEGMLPSKIAYHVSRLDTARTGQQHFGALGLSRENYFAACNKERGMGRIRNLDENNGRVVESGHERLHLTLIALRLHDILHPLHPSTLLISILPLFLESFFMTTA